MKRNDIITFSVLMVLTLVSVVFSTHTRIVTFTLGLLGIKILLVAFQYMELKRAHAFWRYAIVVFVLLVSGIIALIQ